MNRNNLYCIFLGVLYLFNLSCLFIHIHNIAFGDGFVGASVINGALHVYLLFIHSMWIDEVLIDES